MGGSRKRTKNTRTPRAPRDSTSLHAFKEPAPLVVLALSWLLPTTSGRAAPLCLPRGPNAGATAKTPPRHPAPTQVDRPRPPPRQRLATVHAHASDPFRSASLLAPLGSFHHQSEYIKHPQRFKTVSPVWPTQSPLHYGSTRGLQNPLFLPPGLAKRRGMVDSTKAICHFLSGSSRSEKGETRCGK